MMILVEIDEEVLKLPGYGPFAKGDRKNFPDEVAGHICGKGWGHAVNGEIETGERKPGAAAVIEPDKIYHPGG